MFFTMVDFFLNDNDDDGEFLFDEMVDRRRKFEISPAQNSDTLGVWSELGLKLNSDFFNKVVQW